MNNTKPIKLPRDLKPGDRLCCNHGEWLRVVGTAPLRDVVTNRTTDNRDVWRRDGRNICFPKARWIVAIERQAAQAKADVVPTPWTARFPSRAKARQAAKTFGGDLVRKAAKS